MQGPVCVGSHRTGMQRWLGELWITLLGSASQGYYKHHIRLAYGTPKGMGSELTGGGFPREVLAFLLLCFREVGAGC